MNVHTTKSSSAISLPDAGPVFRSSGKILGTRFQVETDDNNFLKALQDYFCGLPPLPDQENDQTTLHFLVILKSPHGAFFRITDKIASACPPLFQTRSLEGHPRPAFGALQMITEQLVLHGREFFIAHAAVVASPAGVLVLCGPSGAGKTTLTLSLLQRGFSYYSDDYCPFHLETRFVHPFPRSILVRSKGEGSFENSPQGGRPLRSEDDRLTSKTVLTQQAATQPGRPRALICLDPGGSPARFHHTRLCIKETAREIIKARLTALSPKILVEDIEGVPFNLHLRYPKKEKLTRPVKALLRQEADKIWHAYRVDNNRPDFSGAPELLPLTVREAALVLLRETRQLPAQPAVVSGGGSLSAGRLLMQVTGLLKGLNCYRMSTGRLEDMTLLAEGAMGERIRRLGARK